MSSPKKKSVRTDRAKRRRKSAHKAITKLPDLSEVIYALADASALVIVASKAVMEDSGGPEANVLRMGVVELERVMDQLEGAELKFAAFRKSNGGAS